MQRKLLISVFVLLSLTALAANSEPLDTTNLVKIATRYQLPVPPKEARLVLADTGWTAASGNQSDSRGLGIYSPAFLLEESTNGSIVVLRGVERETVENRYRRPLWRPFSTADVKPVPEGYFVSFDRLSAFVCAVQLAARGDVPTAQEIWKRFSAAQYWSEVEPFNDIAELIKNPNVLLGRCVYDHLRRRLLQYDDWPDVHSQMTLLFDEFPSLKTTPRKEVLDGLTAAINAKPPKAGSVEGLFLEWSRSPADMLAYGQVARENDTNALDQKIILQGVAAVPGLIALLQNQQITTREISAGGMASPRIQPVGELAEELLEKITGIQPANPESPPEAAVYQAWLRKAEKDGEEEIFAESVFIHEGGHITGENETPIRLLALKYPERLPALFSQFIKDANEKTVPWELAEAMVSARLPKEVRVKALVDFAQTGSLERNRCALQYLVKVDEKKFAELFIPLLQKLPNDCDGPCWTCSEAGLVHAVMQTEDDDIWRRYLHYAKHGSVGLRMEIMEPLDYSYIGATNRARRLAFAAAFLDDKAVRDMSTDEKKFDGPCAAFTFPKIAVRNFAAMKIGYILNLPDQPDEFWTKEQWTVLRKKVRERLASENLPDLTVQEK